MFAHFISFLAKRKRTWKGGREKLNRWIEAPEISRNGEQQTDLKIGAVEMAVKYFLQFEFESFGC